MRAKLPSLEELFAAGAHFGHTRSHSTAGAKSYIWGVRNRVALIDLAKTQEHLAKARDFLKEATKEGKLILLVGTKQIARPSVKAAAQKSGLPYVAGRWPGGLLTNFETVKTSLKELAELEKFIASPDFGVLPKKEKRRHSQHLAKLKEVLGGFEKLEKLPDILLVVDPSHEKVAVSEANRLSVPVVAICDTNANPDLVDFPIPANDDSPAAVQLILENLAEAMKPKVTREDSSKAASAVKKGD